MTREALQVSRNSSLVKQVSLLLFFFFAYGCGGAPPTHTAPTWYYSAPYRAVTTRCVWVGDGDTLKTADGEMVRLVGINAPEIPHPAQGKPVGEAFGEAARDRLDDLVKGETITLVIPMGRERDAYGRVLALVFPGDSPIQGRASANEVLVRDGLAHVFIMENGGFLIVEAWVAAQGGAQRSELGVWSLPPNELPELATDTRNEAIGSIREWARGR